MLIEVTKRTPEVSEHVVQKASRPFYSNDLVRNAVDDVIKPVLDMTSRFVYIRKSNRSVSVSLLYRKCRVFTFYLVLLYK